MEIVLKENPEKRTRFGEVFSHESGRICFGLIYYPTKESADRAGLVVAKSNAEYNGGWFHGMKCGREANRDYIDKETGQPYYAVTY